GTNTKTCSIYAIRANEVDGLHGIYGGGPAGIVVENIGTVQNKDATRIRLKWYVGLVLKSTKSLARLKGVTNI
ncbi:phage major capsid protein, partial [Acinetobacter baumannii]|nr:phage major capsid protein [Acinetobacter baumannii]